MKPLWSSVELEPMRDVETGRPRPLCPLTCGAILQGESASNTLGDPRRQNLQNRFCTTRKVQNQSCHITVVVRCLRCLRNQLLRFQTSPQPSLRSSAGTSTPARPGGVTSILRDPHPAIKQKQRALLVRTLGLRMTSRFYHNDPLQAVK